MFGLGSWEMIAILGVALLIFGGRLPSAARAVGKSLRLFKQGLQEVDVGADVDRALRD